MRSSGTASARRRRGSTKHRARERTLAAQLGELRTAERPGVQAQQDPAPEAGVGDPSGTRLRFGASAYVGAAGITDDTVVSGRPQTETGVVPGLLRSAGGRGVRSCGAPPGCCPRAVRSPLAALGPEVCSG